MYVLTSELQLKVNSRPKVNCRIKFGLVRPTGGRPAQFFSLQLTFSCNSLVSTYMIWASYKYLGNIDKNKIHNRLQYLIQFFFTRIETHFCNESWYCTIFCYWSVSNSWLDSSTKRIIF